MHQPPKKKKSVDELKAAVMSLGGSVKGKLPEAYRKK